MNLTGSVPKIELTKSLKTLFKFNWGKKNISKLNYQMIDEFVLIKKMKNE